MPWHHKLHLRRPPAVERTIFDIGRSGGGLDALDRGLVINGTSVDATFAYESKNASASGFTATFGPDLTAAGSGGTFGLDTPLPSLTDQAYSGDTARYYSGGTGDNNITTGDFVFELVLRVPDDGAQRRLFDKGAAGGRYLMQFLNTGALNTSIDDGTPASVNSAVLTIGAWVHIMVFGDRSGSLAYYVNGDLSGTPAAISAASGSLTNASPFYLGSSGSVHASAQIASVAMWQYDNWFSTHLNATVAQERCHRAWGVYDLSLGSGPVHASLRSTPAYLEKQSAAGTQRLFYVGPRWPRIETHRDSVDHYSRGVRCELAHANLLLRTSEFDNATWAKTNCSITADATDAPTGDQVADTLNEDGTAAADHHVAQVYVQSAGVWCVSVHVKPAARNWVALYLDSATDGTALVYYDAAGGVIGTQSGNDDAGIEYLGDGWSRVWMTDTRATAENATLRVYVTEADGATAFDGLTQASVYLWGAMAVLSPYPVSHIDRTDGASPSTRNADVLRYTGLTLPSKMTAIAELLSITGSVAADRIYGERSDGTANNLHQLLSASGAATGASKLVAGGATEANIASTTEVTSGLWIELRGTVKLNDAKLYINTSLEGTPDTSLSAPSGHTQIDVGCDRAGASQPDAIVRLAYLNQPSATTGFVDVGEVVADTTAYMSTPSGVSQSTAYADVGGTWTQVSATDFSLNTATGVWTYNGTDTRTFHLFASCSGSMSAGGSLLTMTFEKNGTAVTAGEITRDVTSTAVGAWACMAEVELANGDTFNLATKVDSGTPTFTVSRCIVMVIAEQ